MIVLILKGIYGCVRLVSLLHLHFRIGDIVHADDPVDNGKGGGNDGTDDVRHHSCPLKTSFRFQALVVSFPG